MRVPPGTAIIHAGVDPETIGRNSPLRVALLGDSGQVARDLADAIKSLMPAQALRARGAQTRAAAAAYTSRIRQSRLALARRASGGPVP